MLETILVLQRGNARTHAGGNVTVAGFNTMLSYAQRLSRDNTGLDYPGVIGKFRG
jgi:hypothetical protein